MLNIKIFLLDYRRRLWLPHVAVDLRYFASFWWLFWCLLRRILYYCICLDFLRITVRSASLNLAAIWSNLIVKKAFSTAAEVT